MFRLCIDQSKRQIAMNKRKRIQPSNETETVPFLPSQLSKDETINEIIQLHENFLENARNHLLLAKKIGEKLDLKKSEIQRGEWENWVETNLPFKIRTAQYYMKIHKNWDKFVNSQTQSVVLLTEAIELITEKRSIDSKDISEKLRQEKREIRNDYLSLYKRFFKKNESLTKKDKTALFHFLEDARHKRETKIQKYEESIEKTKLALQENKKQLKKILDSL